jgi:hypothetical protein
VIKHERKRITDRLQASRSNELAANRADLVDGKNTLTVTELQAGSEELYCA